MQLSIQLGEALLRSSRRGLRNMQVDSVTWVALCQLDQNTLCHLSLEPKYSTQTLLLQSGSPAC